MNERSNQELAEGLIAADQGNSSPGSESSDSMLEILLEQERQFEERVRRLAIWSWTTTFVCLVVGAVAVTVVREGGGAIVEFLRGLLIILMGTGTIGLIAASVLSLTWLFRSRTPTLRAIERRLAALERRLVRGDAPR